MKDTGVPYILVKYEVSDDGKFMVPAYSRFSDGKKFKSFQTFIGHIGLLIGDELGSKGIENELIAFSMDFRAGELYFAYNLTGDAKTIRDLGFERLT